MQHTQTYVSKADEFTALVNEDLWEQETLPAGMHNRKLIPLADALPEGFPRISGTRLTEAGPVITDASLTAGEQARIEDWFDKLNDALAPFCIAWCEIDLEQKLISTKPIDSANVRGVVRKLAGVLSELGEHEELLNHRYLSISFEWRLDRRGKLRTAQMHQPTFADIWDQLGLQARDAVERMLDLLECESIFLSTLLGEFMLASGINRLLLCTRPAATKKRREARLLKAA